MRKKEVFNIVFSAIMVGLSIVFELIFKLVLVLKMPLGGGISIAMLPLALIAIECGFHYGLIGGIIYGLIDCFLLDGYAFNIVSFILDYIIAFAGIAVLGLFRNKILQNKKSYFILGFLIALIIRWISSGFSGIFNAEAWGYDKSFLEEMFGVGNGSKAWLYFFSFICYNLPYIAVSGVLCISIGLLIYKPVIMKNYDNLVYKK